MNANVGDFRKNFAAYLAQWPEGQGPVLDGFLYDLFDQIKQCGDDYLDSLVGMAVAKLEEKARAGLDENPAVQGYLAYWGHYVREDDISAESLQTLMSAYLQCPNNPHFRQYLHDAIDEYEWGDKPTPTAWPRPGLDELK